MHVIPRVAGEPSLDRRRLVSGVIVEHQMDVKIGRHDLLDLGEEVAEFGRAMTLVAAADDPAVAMSKAANNKVVLCRV
jgi:hypothetical protein